MEHRDEVNPDSAKADANGAWRLNVRPVALPLPHFNASPRFRARSLLLQRVLLVAWVLTLPLEFTKIYFPNQLFEVSRVVLVLCLATFAVQIVVERRELRVPMSASTIGLALYTLYAVVSSFAVGSAEGIRTALSMVAYLLMMLTLFNWVHTEQEHRRIWTALAVSAIIISAVGLVLHLTGSYIWNAPNAGVLRVNATFHDPNIFARFLAFSTLTMVLLAADLEATLIQRGLWVAGAMAAALAFPFTYSRATWGITLVVALVVIAVSRRKMRTVGLAGLAVAIFAGISVIDPSVLSRAALLAQNLESPFKNPVFAERAPWLRFLSVLPLDSVRQYLIGSGLIMFVEHPIFGIGFGTFSQSLLGPYAGLVPPGVDDTASHTSLVTVMAETGLLGLAIVLVIVLSFVRSTWQATTRSKSERALVLAPAIALLVILLTSQLSGRLFEEPYLWLFLGLAFSAQAGLDSG
jgi:putative inorganic carbon (hco3(-)) transporter